MFVFVPGLFDDVSNIKWPFGHFSPFFLQVFFKSMQSKCGFVSKISFFMTCPNFVDIKIDQLDLARRQNNISKLIQYNST